MVTKFFRNSNFSDFLGIKSEINQSGHPGRMLKIPWLPMNQRVVKLLNCELNFALFRKLRRQKKSKFRFLGQFLTLKNMVTKFFRNSNFSDFLGIKSEINHSAS